MAAHLIACPSCARHVRASEATCPFCASAFPEALRAQAPRPGPAVRLSRAALVAFGAGGFIAPNGACSNSSSYGVAIIVDAGSGALDAGAAPDVRSISPPYGTAPHVDAGHDVNVAVPYGVPVQPDAASPVDATDANVQDGKAD